MWSVIVLRMAIVTAQKDLRPSDYRTRVKNGKSGGTPTAFSAVAKSYTPGINASPQGTAAVAARFPYKTNQKHL